MNPPRLLSVQVGAIAEIGESGSGAWWDKAWTTGFRKQQTDTPVWLGYGGLRGDQQADTRHHGGVDKAVCVYPSEHSHYWTSLPAMKSVAPGAFGENFTTTGLLEDTVCIGDVFAIGEALVEVSQPRQPCWKLARHWRIQDLAVQVEQTGRTGFYFRVLRHGWVQQGQSFTLERRPHPAVTVAHANQVMHHRKTDADAARGLAACPALSGSWKDTLWARAQAGTPPTGEGTNAAAR